ncbi:mycofactocin-coupled SDR family oxidoreductase [Blastococcus sp. URHD0036]|uniref:mycofactocin-coupled SDR family oxidoreductase n=1 Tax=Blastococcus sp. URHD0036 TaxID=1380356 RepID=UPI0004959DCF|nr:mycofactocin-coupled SDR family oxidoreductase [Blastococcus sp. URHD0036]
MGAFDGKVVFITGGGRGQGRSHAVTLAEQGADIVLFDVPDQMSTVSYPPASAEDLKETQALVTGLGRRCLAIEGDVRSFEQVSGAVERGIEELGSVDIMLANAGVASYHQVSAMPPEAWSELIDINLTGVFHAMRAVLPHMIDRGSGRIIATSSTMGRGGARNGGHYAASKWGIIGLVKSAALEAGQHGVTVNAVCPVAVLTPLIQNEEIYHLFRPDLENPTWEDCKDGFAALNPMGVSHIDALDVSHMVAFLASDQARFVTGAVFDVTAGKSATWTG